MHVILALSFFSCFSVVYTDIKTCIKEGLALRDIFKISSKNAVRRRLFSLLENRQNEIFNGY